MAVVWTWPPVVRRTPFYGQVMALAGVGVPYGYYFQDKAPSRPMAVDVPNRCYVGSVVNNYTGQLNTLYDTRYTVSPTADIVVSNFVEYGPATGQYTTTANGINVYGDKDQTLGVYPRRFPDVSPTAQVFFCTMQVFGGTVLAPTLRCADTPVPYSLYAYTLTTVVSKYIEVFQASSASVWLFFLQTTNVSGTDYQHIHWSRFDTATGVFTTGAPLTSLAVAEATASGEFIVADAGEGYAYVMRRESSRSVLVSVDLNGSTPVVTAAGEDPVSVVGHPYLLNDRYITVAGTRYLVWRGAYQYRRLAFTTATRTSPVRLTFDYNNPNPEPFVCYDFTLEYAPEAPDEAYIVGYRYQPGSNQLYYAFYTKLTDPSVVSPGEYAFINVSKYRPGEYYNWGQFSSARAGALMPSMMVFTATDNSTNPLVSALYYNFWHETETFSRNVLSDSTYSSVSVAPRTTFLRSVSVNYSAVSVGVFWPSEYVGKFAWQLGASSIMSFGVDVGRELSSVTVGLQVLQLMEGALTQHTTDLGSVYMSQFVALVNAERATLGLPPYLIYGDDGKFLGALDIATLQSSHMARLRYFEHIVPAAPLGERTVAERVAKAGTSGAENLLYWPTMDLQSVQTSPPPTPQELFDGWKSSPPHYANIVFDWSSVTNGSVYTMLGVCLGGPPTNLPGFEYYSGLYFTNIFLYLETVMFEVALEQSWANEGALVAELAQQWSNAAYVHVAARHEAKYAIRVAFQVEAPWGCRAAFEHTAPITYTASAQCVFPYEPLSPVKQQHTSGYSVLNTTRVAAQHDSGYGIRAGTVLEAGWSALGRVVQQVTTPYGERLGVAAQHATGYSILSYNRATAALASYYSLQDAYSLVPTNSSVYVILASGERFRVEDGVLENSSGDVGYSFTFSVTDLALFSRLVEDDPITVDFAGELYALFISSMSMSRNDATDVGMRVSANSAAARLGNPYVANLEYAQAGPAMASDLVRELVEINFNYEVVDWLIPAGRLQVSGSSPLDAVTQLAEACGGVVDSSPDGSLRVRYRYPVPMNALDSVVVAHTYTDEYDNLSVSTSSSYRDGSNYYRVREGLASFSDSMDWQEDEKQYDPLYSTGVLKAYPSPYRENVRIVHVGGAISITHLGVASEVLEEMVEFAEGLGNTRRPIATLTSVEWSTPSLGSPAWASYSTSLTASTAVSEGYGLAKVTYTTQYVQAKVSGLPATSTGGGVGPASAYAYFVLEEVNA